MEAQGHKRLGNISLKKVEEVEREVPRYFCNWGRKGGKNEADPARQDS